MIFKTYFGWTENSKWFLSVFPPEQKMPKNEYNSKADAEADAARRGAGIKWLS